MIPWVLVYKEHYDKYREIHQLEESVSTFQAFLKDIGTPSLVFQKPTKVEESNYVSYVQAPQGSCIRLRTSQNYAAVLHEKLFPASNEKQDKSRRSSSCTIV